LLDARSCKFPFPFREWSAGPCHGRKGERSIYDGLLVEMYEAECSQKGKAAKRLCFTSLFATSPTVSWFVRVAKDTKNLPRKEEGQMRQERSRS
jgi:hypothetical protein